MIIHSYINIIIGINIVRYILMDIHTEKEIIKLLGKERVITSSELAKHLKVSWNTAEKYLLELTIELKVERIKKAGVNLWMLK